MIICFCKYNKINNDRNSLEVNFDPANRNTFLPAGIKIYFHLLNHQQFSLFHFIPSLSSISVSNYISYIHYRNVYFWNLLCVKYLFCLQLAPKNTKVSPPKINKLFILKYSLLKDYSFIAAEPGGFLSFRQNDPMRRRSSVISGSAFYAPKLLFSIQTNLLGRLHSQKFLESQTPT